MNKKAKKDEKIYWNGALRTKETIKKIRKYQDEYMKENYRRFQVRMHKVKDADVIELLESKKSMNDYIRQLIKKDIYGE